MKIQSFLKEEFQRLSNNVVDDVFFFSNITYAIIKYFDYLDIMGNKISKKNYEKLKSINIQNEKELENINIKEEYNKIN